MVTEHSDVQADANRDMATAIARKLDSIKNRSGVSAREVAQLWATTPQTVSRWQTGRASPQPDR
jgi:DNA-binding transcriptional regulator YiaG